MNLGGVIGAHLVTASSPRVVSTQAYLALRRLRDELLTNKLVTVRKLYKYTATYK